jgi:hypothetical protein
MHPWRTGADYYTVQLVFFNGLLNDVLSYLAAGIFVIFNIYYVGELLGGLNNRGDIHCSRYVPAAMAHKNPDS